MEWKKYFNNGLIERGLNYYKHNHVKIISSTSRIVEATVHGSDDYNIRIKFNNGEIKSMACDCYYYMHENNCKHLATVFHY